MPVIEIVEGLRFDVVKLQAYLEEVVFPLAPEMQAPGFGGWTIQSSNGDCRDGWQMGHMAYTTGVKDAEVKKRDRLKPDMFFYKPTQVYQGYITEVMDVLQKAKLNPKRARITMVPPGEDTSWHRDAPADTYCARLHIPIITNDDCYFVYEGQEPFHMPADGRCYIVDPSFRHKAGNNGRTHRYHVLVNIWDTGGLTENFRYQHGINMQGQQRRT